MYIIIYNAETDFFEAPTPEDAATQIEALFDNGYARDDIQLYKAIAVEFKVEVNAKVKVEGD